MSLRRLNAEPDGFCRIYYRGDNHALYCWQEDWRDRWSFYRCSQDGEPSHMVALKKDQPAFPASEGRPTSDWVWLAVRAAL
jgi:hypothetical protein